MNTSVRQSWVIAAAIVLGCLILGLFLGQPSPAQNAQAQPPATASPRYQIVPCPHEGSKDVIVIMELETGHCWGTVAGVENKWIDMGVPGKVEKKGQRK